MNKAESILGYRGRTTWINGIHYRWSEDHNFYRVDDRRYPQLRGKVPYGDNGFIDPEDHNGPHYGPSQILHLRRKRLR